MNENKSKSNLGSSSRFSIILLGTLIAVGCVSPKPPHPPVTTLWQRLGIPQATIGLRDHLVNRKGFRPDLERKPPLLTLADPKNLESPSALLKNAAEIKADQDLAPQKIKALKYLAEVACGCEPEKVTEAIMAGLEDCSPEVRAEAVKVVLASAGQPVCDPNDPKNKKRHKIIGACKQCKSQGCSSCGYSGYVECCEDYSGCQPCGACCTEEVQKRLKQMAYEQKDNGCWYEPDWEIRNLAAMALEACPPLPPKKPDEDKIPKTEGNGGPVGEGITDQDGSNNSARFYSSRQQMQPVSAGRNASSNMVAGLIAEADFDSRLFTITLDRPYQLPRGATVLLESVSGHQIELEIVDSKTGSIMAYCRQPISPISEFGHRSTVLIGILNK